VKPELADTASTTDGQVFKQSIVEVMGNTINMQSGSSITVPGGKVTLAAISSYIPLLLQLPRRRKCLQVVYRLQRPVVFCLSDYCQTIPN